MHDTSDLVFNVMYIIYVVVDHSAIRCKKCDVSTQTILQSKPYRGLGGDVVVSFVFVLLIYFMHVQSTLGLVID